MTPGPLALNCKYGVFISQDEDFWRWFCGSRLGSDMLSFR